MSLFVFKLMELEEKKVCYCVMVELVSFVFKTLLFLQEKRRLCYLLLAGWRDGGDPSSRRRIFVPSRSNRPRVRTGAPPPPDLFLVTYCWWAGWTEVVPHHVDIYSSRLVVIARGSVQWRPHQQIVPVLPGPAKFSRHLSS